MAKTKETNMSTELLDRIPLRPETRKAYEAMDAPARAWALAKAVFEAAHDANFAEQREAIRLATLDDPEPHAYDNLPYGATRERCTAALDVEKAWYDRNRERIDLAAKPIVARYPSELEKLAELAEQNMVDDAEQKIRAQFGARFAQVAPAFEAYREGLLYGDKLKTFLGICFSCPAN